MIPLMGFLTGPLGKVAGYAAVAFVLAGGLAVAVHDYNALILSRADASSKAAQMALMQSDHNKIVSGLTIANAAAVSRADRAASIKEAINATPASTCPVPASIRAAMGGLRSASADGHGKAPAHP